MLIVLGEKMTGRRKPAYRVPPERTVFRALPDVSLSYDSLIRTDCYVLSRVDGNISSRVDGRIPGGVDGYVPGSVDGCVLAGVHIFSSHLLTEDNPQRERHQESE
jgi:hypothetical protein